MKMILDLYQRIRKKDTKYYKKIGVKMGEDVHILSSQLDETNPWLIEIGSHVTITRADILTHDASTIRALGGYSKVGKVKIGDNVFIGHSCIVLPGTCIGNNVICGCGSILSGNIPDNSVVVGNPWKVVGTYDDYVKKHRRNFEEGPNFKTLYYLKTEEEREEMVKNIEYGQIRYSR